MQMKNIFMTEEIFSCSQYSDTKKISNTTATLIK